MLIILLIIISIISISISLYFYKTKDKVGIYFIPETFWDILVEHGMPTTLSTLLARKWLKDKLDSIS